MMVVTHEMGFARKVANRVIFIDVGGRILEDCTQGRVLRQSGSAAAADQGFPEQDPVALNAAATVIEESGLEAAFSLGCHSREGGDRAS